MLTKSSWDMNIPIPEPVLNVFHTTHATRLPTCDESLARKETAGSAFAIIPATALATDECLL